VKVKIAQADEKVHCSRMTFGNFGSPIGERGLAAVGIDSLKPRGPLMIWAETYWNSCSERLDATRRNLLEYNCSELVYLAAGHLQKSYKTLIVPYVVFKSRLFWFGAQIAQNCTKYTDLRGGINCMLEM
jgi:hypothetical protein